MIFLSNNHHVVEVKVDKLWKMHTSEWITMSDDGPLLLTLFRDKCIIGICSTYNTA